MSLADSINADIKAAMLARDKEKLEALRAVKAALLMAATEKGASGAVTEEAELQVLQRLVKQRKEAATIFREQGRDDLAGPEEAQAEVISAYLPTQMSEDEVKAVIARVIADSGAAGMQDMGKVMGMSIKALQGKADGKLISSVVKQLLS